jgi:hypothetical protein
MKMTPDDFFVLFVEGNSEDYFLNSGCIRQAFNAAVSASQLADHYYKYNKKHNPAKVNSFNRIGDFVEYVSLNTNGCFRDIRSIANAYKHLYTLDDPKMAIYTTIGSPGAFESISFLDKKAKIKEIKEELTEDLTTSKVVFTRIDGQKIDFPNTLETVIDFWKVLLYK